MGANYNLLASQHNATATLREPAKAPRDATSYLADASEKLTVQLHSGLTNILYWDIEFDVPTVIKCVYIERISIASNQVLIRNLANGDTSAPIAQAQQVDDYLYVDVPEVVTSRYRIELEIDSSQNSVISMTAPFIGGIDLSAIHPYGYANGRGYQFADTVTFQRTKDASYAEVSAAKSKDFVIPRIKPEHSQFYYEFMVRNTGRLVLMREHENNDRHNYSLGYLNPKKGSRPISNHDFEFSIELKNIGSERFDDINEFSLPYIPPTPPVVEAPEMNTHIDVTGLHPTYGQLVGAVDGTNPVFVTSIEKYDPGSVEVIYKGMQQTDFVETSPLTGVITLGFNPKSNSQGNEVLVKYEETV